MRKIRSLHLGVALGALMGLAGTNVAIAKDVNWPALNPIFEGATFVRDSNTCYQCHDTTKTPYSHTAHAQAFKAKPPAGGDCESCHGPRSKHVEKPGRDHVMDVAQQGKACLQCHDGGGRKHWAGSAHANADVSCTSCHSVMQKKSEKGLLVAAKEDATCYKCHSDIRAELNKQSHHPVREGKMSCSSCHNAHGTATSGMLKANSVNENCYSCHQEKRGPFVWEHAPVRENCLNCHSAHGANNNKLMTSKGSFTCLQCHTYGGHINLPRYNRTSNPYGEGCVNCHVTVHGSISPSGAKFVR